VVKVGSNLINFLVAILATVFISHGAFTLENAPECTFKLESGSVRYGKLMDMQADTVTLIGDVKGEQKKLIKHKSYFSSITLPSGKLLDLTHSDLESALGNASYSDTQTSEPPSANQDDQVSAMPADEPEDEVPPTPSRSAIQSEPTNWVLIGSITGIVVAGVVLVIWLMDDSGDQNKSFSNNVVLE
jgi:hypothetical protein